MIFVTADQHLFHTNIIHMKDRPFSSVDNMTDKLVANWNSVVTDADTVYVLGDFIGKEAVDKKQIVEIGNSLNGHKILLKGNHDKNYPMVSIFEQVYNPDHIVRIEYEGTEFLLNHWLANMTVIGDFPEHLYLHAHQHNKVAYNVLNAYFRRPYYDVGVDANRFSPISLESIIIKFNNPPSKMPIFICRECGARMVLREGPYGRFFGCSNYPKCNFKTDVEIDRRTADEKREYRKSLKTGNDLI